MEITRVQAKSGIIKNIYWKLFGSSGRPISVLHTLITLRALSDEYRPDANAKNERTLGSDISFYIRFAFVSCGVIFRAAVRRNLVSYLSMNM